MACKDLNPKFTTSEASTKAWMRTRGLIDEYLNILNTNGFREANKKWSEYAQAEYDTEGMLFEEENNKAYANREKFKKIDEAKDITYEQRTSTEDSISVDEFEAQRKKIKSIMGFDIIYDENLETSAEVKGKTIKVNPNKLFRDTLVHEIAHILIDAIGGLDNPMVRRGIKQLESTALGTEVYEEYSDVSEDIRKKELLAQGIGKDGAEIFGKRADRVNKWQRWLDLFWTRVKQVFGYQPSVAKIMAQQIIYHKPNFGSIGAETTYYQKDQRIKELKNIVKQTQAALNSEVKLFKQSERPGYKETIEELQALIKRLENAELEVSVRSYINIAKGRVEALKDRLQRDDLTFEDYRHIKDYLGPYRNVEQMQTRLEALDLDDSDELMKTATQVVGDINTVTQKYYQGIKDLAAEKLSKSENGNIHIKWKEKFQDEFDDKNITPGIFSDKKTLNGKKVSTAEYNTAQSAYVAEKMDQYRDKIEKEEEEYLREIFERTPNDLGWFEHFAYEGQLINDDIIQVVNELMTKADNQVRGEYLKAEGEANKIYQEYREYHKSLNQQKKWDKLLADELDIDGNPTGNKIPYFTGSYNPSFVKHKKALQEDLKEAKRAAEHAFMEYQGDNVKFEQEYNEAVKKKQEAEDAYIDWLKKNTIKSGDKYIPTKKWQTDEASLTETEKKMKDYIMDMVDKIDEAYPAGGALTQKDDYIGQYIRLPSVNKTTLEKFTDGNLFENVRESFKDIITPREEDIGYQSIRHASEALTRDGKLHHQIPIYFRSETKDQSFDVLSAIMMDYHMALNYKHKRGIEAEVLALQDISRERTVAETKSNFSMGIQSIKNMFNDEDVVGMQETPNLEKTLDALVNARLYGIRRKGNEKIQKLVDSLISFSSSVIMPLNVFSAVSNLVMGKTTSAIDILGGDILSVKELASAEKEYIKNLPGTLGDMLRPKKHSYINKIMEKYDSMADFYGPTFRFAEDTKVKQLFNRGTLYGMTRAVEHYIHGVITLASLKSAKLQNKNGEFINKEGKVVENGGDAATMYDYLDIADGEITYAEIQDAYKTNLFDAPLGTPEHENLMKSYIRDLVAQTQGQYDSKEFSVSELNVLARMFFGLRQWIPRGFERSWRGASYTFADEIPEHAKMRSRSSGKTRVGMQTQFWHTTAKSGKGLWEFGKSLISEGEKLKFDIVKQPWQELNARERSEVRRAVTQYGVATAMWVTSTVLYNLATEDDDEIPDEVLYLVFALERAKQELMFYTNPAEVLRILKSPAASISMIENFIGLGQQAMSDTWNAQFERYERGRFKDQTKLGKDITDMLPVFSQFNRDVETALSYIKNIQAK